MSKMSCASLLILTAMTFGCISRDLPEVEVEPTSGNSDAMTDTFLDGGLPPLDDGGLISRQNDAALMLDSMLDSVDSSRPDAAVVGDVEVIDAELSDVLVVDAVLPTDASIMPDVQEPMETASCDSPSSGFGPWRGVVRPGRSLHDSGCGGGAGTEYIVLFTAPVAGTWVFSTSNEKPRHRYGPLCERRMR